jgi:hypothetical protein
MSDKGQTSCSAGAITGVHGFSQSYLKNPLTQKNAGMDPPLGPSTIDFALYQSEMDTQGWEREFSH